MPEAINLSLLAGPLPVMPAAGLASDDPDLHSATFQFSRGDYEEAAQAAAALFRRRVYDVRLLPAFFVGAFLEGGVPALADTLHALVPLLGSDFQAFGPSMRKLELCDTSLLALFRALLQLLEYHDAQRDGTWTGWVLACDEEHVDAIVNACAAVGDAARKTLPSGSSPGEIAKLRAWADVTFRGIVGRHSMLPELKADPPPAAPAATVSATRTAAQPARKPTRPPPPPPAPTAPAPPAEPAPASDHVPAALAAVPDTLELKTSPALKLLLQKLQAFEILVDRGDLQKAAVVARDLDKVLGAFDPKVYLPALLSPYFARLSAHVDALAPHLDAAEGRAWQVLEHFYQVDLDAFVQEPQP